MKKYIPCYGWEIGATEQWLSEQAEKGLDLVDITLHFAKFHRAEPKQVRYRLDQPELGRLTPEEQEYFDACTKAGWDYVCDFGDCHVFRTEAENAGELQSDVESRRQLLEKVLNRQITLLTICASILLALLLIIYRLISEWGTVYILMQLGIFRSVLFFVLLPLSALPLIGEFVSIVRLKKFISLGRESSRIHRGTQIYRGIVLLFGLALGAVSLVLSIQDSTTRSQVFPTQLTESVAAALPFPTLEDISKEDFSALESMAGTEQRRNEITAESNSFQKVKTQTWQTEYGPEEVSPAGHTMRTVLVEYYVEYSEFTAGWLAAGYARDLPKTEAGFYTCIPLSAPGFDEAFYGTDRDGQLLILHRGKTVLKVTYLGSADLREHLDLFAEKMG